MILLIRLVVVCGLCLYFYQGNDQEEEEAYVPGVRMSAVVAILVGAALQRQALWDCLDRKNLRHSDGTVSDKNCQIDKG